MDFARLVEGWAQGCGPDSPADERWRAYSSSVLGVDRSFRPSSAQAFGLIVNFALHSIRPEERAILLGFKAGDFATLANVRERRILKTTSALAFSASYYLRGLGRPGGAWPSFTLAAINGPDFLSVRGLKVCAPSTIIAHGSCSALQKLSDAMRYESEAYNRRSFTLCGQTIFVGEA